MFCFVHFICFTFLEHFWFLLFFFRSCDCFCWKRKLKSMLIQKYILKFLHSFFSWILRINLHKTVTSWLLGIWASNNFDSFNLANQSFFKQGLQLDLSGFEVQILDKDLPLLFFLDIFGYLRLFWNFLLLRFLLFFGFYFNKACWCKLQVDRGNEVDFVVSKVLKGCLSLRSCFEFSNS